MKIFSLLFGIWSDDELPNGLEVQRHVQLLSQTSDKEVLCIASELGAQQ